MTAAVPKGKGGVDRNALPRYLDGSQWWPPGVARDADDATLIAALRGAWGTPRWALDLALDVRELLGGPAAALGFDLDAGTRPGTASWPLSDFHLDGYRYGDALQDDLAWTVYADACHLDVPDRLPSTVWCNFPFSDPKPWVERAIQAAHDGCWVNVLAPHTTGAWWDDLRTRMLCEVPLRKVCFEACPGLLDAKGRPATGDAPSQQCSLVTLAPGGHVVPTSAPRYIDREVPKLGLQRFVLLQGPALAA